MTDITTHKDPARVLRNMIVGIDGIRQTERGTNIVYFRGDFSDNVNRKAVGKMAMDLATNGHCHLKQRIIGETMTDAGMMRQFEYIAEVR